MKRVNGWCLRHLSPRMVIKTVLTYAQKQRKRTNRKAKRKLLAIKKVVEQVEMNLSKQQEIAEAKLQGKNKYDCRDNTPLNALNLLFKKGFTIEDIRYS